MTLRVTIPIDLSTRSFIPLPRFFNSRRVTTLLNQSLVLIPPQSVEVPHDVCYVENFIEIHTVYHSSNVTFFPYFSSCFFLM